MFDTYLVGFNKALEDQGVESDYLPTWVAEVAFNESVDPVTAVLFSLEMLGHPDEQLVDEL